MLVVYPNNSVVIAIRSFWVATLADGYVVMVLKSLVHRRVDNQPMAPSNAAGKLSVAWLDSTSPYSRCQKSIGFSLFNMRPA